MSIRNNKHFIFSGPIRDNYKKDRLGKLSLVYQSQDESPGFELLDTFDQEIRKSGQVLLFSENTLTLIQQKGINLTQSVARSPGFVTDLQDGEIKTALGFVSPLRRLISMSRGSVNHTIISAIDDEEKTHARAHLQILTADKTETQVTLVSVQPIRGYGNAFKLMTDYVKELGIPLQSRISGLYEQIITDYCEYDPKPEIAITRDEKAFQAANDIINTYIQVARANEAGIMADIDTEYLHDYRVSLRKVRSVISLFKEIYSENQTQTLKQTFSELMAPTGRLRDLDVYLLDKQNYFGLLPESLHDGLKIMFGLFAKERNKELGKMKKLLKSSAYNNSMSELFKLFEEHTNLEKGANADHSAYLYACELIWKRYRKVCKIARAIDDTTPDEPIHTLRIHCKKLRYLMEFFSPMFKAKEIKALIKALKGLQDNLGLFNDYSVQQSSLQEFLINHRSRDRKRDLIIAKSVGALIASLNQRQLEERAKVVSNFAVFHSVSTDQKFRELFKHEVKTTEVTE